MILALTRYNVAIPRAFADRAAALKWAAEHGNSYPNCRLVSRGSDGRDRTFWRQVEKEAA